jgi:hypothetical protein
MSDFSVHDQPDFERVYDEDEMIQVRKGDLRALLDLATGSMDFGSGFWNNEDVECARTIARLLDVRMCAVTPSNFQKTYEDTHRFEYFSHVSQLRRLPFWEFEEREDGLYGRRTDTLPEHAYFDWTLIKERQWKSCRDCGYSVRIQG